jgi:hypothetical protein
MDFFFGFSSKIKNPPHIRYNLHISCRWVGIIHLESPFRLQCQRSTASGQSQDERLQPANPNSSPIINGKTPNAQSEKQIERRKISWALYQPLCTCCCLRDAWGHGLFFCKFPRPEGSEYEVSYPFILALL